MNIYWPFPAKSPIINAMEQLSQHLSFEQPHPAANINDDWTTDSRQALVVLAYCYRADKAKLRTLPPGSRRTELEALHNRTLHLIQRMWALQVEPMNHHDLPDMT